MGMSNSLINCAGQDKSRILSLERCCWLVHSIRTSTVGPRRVTTILQRSLGAPVEWTQPAGRLQFIQNEKCIHTAKKKGRRGNKNEKHLVSVVFLGSISAPQKKKKNSLILSPALLWWRWMHLCCASFGVSSEGAPSCSQTPINRQATAPRGQLISRLSTPVSGVWTADRGDGVRDGWTAGRTFNFLHANYLWTPRAALGDV